MGRNWESPGWLSVGIFALIVAFYFGLVPLGQWQADEFDYFGRLRQAGVPAFITRMSWSPRPVAEPLYIIYGLLANSFHRPLAGVFLGLLWIGFLFCACFSAWTGGDKDRRLPALLTGLALAAAFLTSGPLFQVFYWPAGAVAYLPTLAATLLVFLQILDGRLSSSRGRTLCCFALLVAALSSEMGAMFAASFAIFEAITSLRRTGEHEGRIAWWLLPGVAGAGVLLWLATHRLPAAEAAFTVTSAALHSPLQSALAAAGRLALEVVGWSSGTKHASSVLLSLMSRLALAAGVALLWPKPQGPSQSERSSASRQIPIIGAALLAACFASLFASYLHFGAAGGERYETLRRCWIVLAYATLGAAFLAARFQKWRVRGNTVATLLLLAGVLLPWHVSPLAREYAAYGRVRDAVEQTFQSGYQPGSEMFYAVPPSGGVITPAVLGPGTYTATSQATEFNYAGYILTYFSKQTLVVSPLPPQADLPTAPPAP